MTNKVIMKNKSLMTYLCICVFLVFLCSLFPWSLDDWMWGSSKGIGILKTGFKDYNGRYLGNLLAMLLTRSRVLRACVMAVTHTTLLYFLSELSGRLEGRTTLFAALLLLMPVGMIAEVIAWTSGFANYVPSFLISIIYIYIVRNIFEEDGPEYKWATPIMTLLLGIIGALFVEHMTVYNICLALFVIVYIFMRLRRVYISHVAFLTGTVLGACIMFSNGAYQIISRGDYHERTIAHGFSDILQRAYRNYIDVIMPTGFRESWILLLALCVAACIASSVFRGKVERKWRFRQEMSLYFIIVFTSFVLVENVGKIEYREIWRIFEITMSVLYLLAWAVFLLSLPIPPGITAKLLFYFGSAIVLNASLLIVTPVGPRCLFAAYGFLCVLTVSLLNITFNSIEESVKRTIQRPIRIARDAVAICAIVSAYYLVYIYGTIAYFDHYRIEKIRADLAEGDKTLYVQNMIYDKYVFHGNPTKGATIDTWFKDFYGIDEGITIENIG